MDEIYSVPLALEDFLPVIFSGIGLFYVARMVSKMDKALSVMAYLGVALITLGGLSKASWKLIYALSESQTNIQIMDNALFFGLSTGFILLAYAVWYAQRSYFEEKRPGNIWLFPIIVCIATVGAALYTGSQYDPERDSPQVWFLILLGMTTIFNFVTLGLAIRQAKRQKQMLAVALFCINLAAIIILQGIARTGDRTEASQWVAQITNTISQMGLIYGAWLIYSYVAKKDKTGESAPLSLDEPELHTA